MSRAIDTEWIGTTDDTSIPPRVKIRLFDKYHGRCAICTRPIEGNIRPAYDHITALVNGGRNAESNLQLLCVSCHSEKTKTDVAEKSIIARVRAKHLGMFSPRKKIQSAGFRKAAPQRTASRPLERRTYD